ncbi:hypothetical protein AKJ37_06490 [candidate division MSBL1 archaeon SCGC-AAA259I09]|uniref:ABC transporter permease n=1 Tax=candidate division MSBL1 archaeon SCGC-AAA259I09 TaxID=1698267 RepID=A0A133UP24_9EURY|nr:hypothetical protein AKJ37_06490 [candidate division MSBL1 archaeon SCGC-AAA259I09]
MTLGAYLGFLGALIFSNPWMGLLLGALAGLFISLIHGYLSITLGVNQIVSGLGFWFIGVGVANFSYQRFSQEGIEHIISFKSIMVSAEGVLKIFGDLKPPFYLGLVMIVISIFLFYKTHFGLNVRSVGENPIAADVAGIKVNAVRYMSVALSGSLSGLGGAILSISRLSEFSLGIVGGRGFLVITIVFLGNWDLKFAVIGAFLISFVEAFSLWVNVVFPWIPYPLLYMLPYIAALLGVGIWARKGKMPSSLLIPYRHL